MSERSFLVHPARYFGPMRVVLFVLAGSFAGEPRAQWTSADTAKVMELNAACFDQADRDPAKALSIGREALALAQQMAFIGGQAQAHGYLGYAYMRKSAFDSAQAEYGIAMRLYQDIGGTCDLAATLFNVGLNHQMQQQQDSALACFTKVLELEERCSSASTRSTRLFAIGSSYEALLRFQEALGYYDQALALDSERKDSSRLAQEHIAVANMLSALEQYDAAVEHYEQSIAISTARGDGLMAGYIHYNLGELAMRRGDADGALRNARESVDLFIQLDRKAELAHASILLGSLLVRMKNGKEAESHLLNAFRLADSLGLRDDRAMAMHELALAKEAQDDARGAMEWMKRYVAYDDSLKKQDRDARMAEMTARYETEKKEQALALAEAELEKQRSLKLAYLLGASALAMLLIAAIAQILTRRRAASALARTNAEVLRQKERAEESERAKDRFLANVSHEIRTPLNAIMGFTGLLMHEHRDERSARYLGNIREAGDNLLVVINDVLDLSRIEAGRLQLVKEPFDLHRSMRLCKEILLHRARAQGNTLTARVDANVGQWVLGDSARVLQILLNLTGNALKFTQNGAVEVTAERRDGHVLFSVRDNGIGIPAEKLGSIFERFTQVDVHDQRKYGGTGLGLSIVKELVDLHGGRVDVRSEVGKGTTFTVDLPLAATAAPETSAIHAPSSSTGSLSGRTILIAEDNEMNALVTTETMRRYYPGADLMVVRTGREAVERIDQDLDGDIGLVLMDVQMPEMDGMTATRRIRGLDGDRARVPIIALTASVLPSDLSRCLDAGMDACVPKPFKADELLRAIGSLTGDQGASPGVGYDVHDPNVALFHWLIPPRLKALRAAQSKMDPGQVKQLVHTMRPQLVARDAQRFAPLCDRILTSDGELHGTDIEALASAIDEALA